MTLDRTALRSCRESSRGAWSALLFFGCAALGACGEDPALEPSAVAKQVSASVVDPAVVISQIYGGGGNASATYTHDFIELFNRSSSAVVVASWSLQYGSTTGNLGNSGLVASFPVGATIQPGQYYLVQLAGGAIGAALPTADHIPAAAINMAQASGKIALVDNTTALACGASGTPCGSTQEGHMVDLVGYGASATYYEAAATGTNISSSLSVSRLGGGCTDSNNNNADFAAPALPAPRNSSSPLAPCGGDSAPSVATTSPIDGASGVSASTNVSITFSEPVAVAGAWYSFSCSISGAISAAVSGGATTFTLTPSAALAPGDVCQVVITATLVTDLDSTDPPDAMAANYTLDFTVASPALAVHAVQGVSHSSPYAGQTQTVGPAVVTALRGNGFFMQDPTPDGSNATSEGIFVFTSVVPTRAVGDLVTVTGTIAEFRPGCSGCAPSSSAYDNLTMTEITSPVINLVSSGQPLPPPVVLGTGVGQRAAPLAVIDDDATGNVETSGTFDADTDGIDFYESLEGMRVQLNAPVVVDPTRTFTSSREIGVLARSDASLRTGRGGIIVSDTDFNPERVFLANDLVGSALLTFPDVNVGDSFASAVIGVVDYNFANYKVLVTGALPSVVSGGLTPEITALVPANATQLTMASMNMENLDALDPGAKFSQLAGIVVQNLGSPDLIAVEEVQDNNGATNDSVVSASLTFSTLINAITTAGGPTYQYRQIDPVDDQDGGEPGGNIRVGFLFRTDRGLAFVDRGAATSTTANGVNTSGASPLLDYSPGRLEPTDAAFSSSRKPLAAEVTFAGTRFFVIANHWNSKGGDDPLYGRFQPPVLSSEAQRNQQAAIVSAFIDELLTADESAAVVVLGDLNDFSFAPPVEQLEAVGMIDLLDTLPASERYSYVYQGNSQDLDHILVSPGLGSLATYDVVHVNAEFAVQASDHDPSLVRIQIPQAPTLSMGGNPSSIPFNGGLSFQVTATGSPAPTFSLVSGPLGMTVHATTGVVSWTANVAPGTYLFTVQASNVAGMVSRQYSVTVLAAGAHPVPALPALAGLLMGTGLFLAAARALRRRRSVR